MTEISKRKGARSLKEIPTEILFLLNKGTIESVNLTEWLAIDQSVLVENIIPKKYVKACLEAIEELKTKTVTQNYTNYRKNSKISGRSRK